MAPELRTELQIILLCGQAAMGAPIIAPESRVSFARYSIRSVRFPRGADEIRW